MKFVLVVLCATLGLSAAVTNCTKGSDCPTYHECCVQVSPGVGTCKAMGSVAAVCYTNKVFVRARPQKMVDDSNLCPCRIGLFCAAINRKPDKYGQMGICTFG